MKRLKGKAHKKALALWMSQNRKLAEGRLAHLNESYWRLTKEKAT